VTSTSSIPQPTTITPETSGASSADLIFDVHASSLPGLNYTNGHYALKTAALSSPSGTTDVLVSFNSLTGKVDTIAPFIASRIAAGPVRQGTDLVFQAKFSGVWNEKGKNLAPQGASEVMIDPETGKLVSES